MSLVLYHIIILTDSIINWIVQYKCETLEWLYFIFMLNANILMIPGLFWLFPEVSYSYSMNEWINIFQYITQI